MAESNRDSDVEMFFEDEFTFEDSLFATTDLSFDNDSIQPTFISEEDVVELIGAQEFRCTLCVKTFKSKTGLDIHVEKKHYSQPKEAFFNQSICKESREHLLKENIYSAEFIKRLPSEVPVRLQSFINNLVFNKLLAGKYKNDHDSLMQSFRLLSVMHQNIFLEAKLRKPISFF
eukprot:gene2271-2610_t